jgi:serine/threonine-protein kinase
LELSEQDTVIRGGSSLAAFFSLRGLPSLTAKDSVQPAGAPASAGYAGAAAAMDALQADWAPSGAAMDASGKLQGSPPPRIAPVRESAGPLHEAPIAKALPPKAARDPISRTRSERLPADIPALRFWPDQPPRKRGGLIKWTVLLAIVVIGALEGPRLYALALREGPQLLKRGSSAVPLLQAAPLLQIDSQPQGAIIRIGDHELGETPMYIENNYPDRKIEVRLSLKGYQPWKGTFSGGQAASVYATLKRR